MATSPSGPDLDTDSIQLTRRQLIEMMKSCGNPEIEKQYEYLREEIKTITKSNINQDHMDKVNHILSHFKSQYKARWAKANRMQDRFDQTNECWLDTVIYIPVHKHNKVGRPEIPFSECSDRTKRSKTKDLRDNTPLEVLNFATQMSLRAAGQTEAAYVLKDITSASPKRAGKYIQAFTKSKEPPQRKMSGEDALAVLVEAQLTRNQFNVIRSSAPERFPCYTAVQKAKQLCYPNDIKVTETSATVGLQSLLDHTVDRLLTVVAPVIDTVCEIDLSNFKLFVKWGFDGSSGHSSYKQAFCDSESSDSSVFITCIVPLRLTYGEDTVIWKNPRPGSTRYCRPLKIEFKKESTESSVLEKNRVDDEIRQLRCSISSINEKQIQVHHRLLFTMVDGKVCNSLTGTTSTKTCYICGASSKDFNNVNDMIKRSVDTANLGFGLSVLHGWIRMFECLLHLSYKLPITKWQARGPDKEVVAENKARIQREFKERCGLIVDKLKPGFGNTNDGNTARRFFKNAQISAEITGISKELIEKVHTIMVTVSSGYDIHVEKFREYTQSTARLFVHLYPWYNMPPTVHKYLIHGPEVVKSALLPIGQFTEEALEARNKDFKKCREHYSRKVSREKTNQDVFHYMLVTSDPVITSKRKLPIKKLQKIPKEALDLLCPPRVSNSSSSGGYNMEVDTESEEYSESDYYSDTEQT